MNLPILHYGLILRFIRFVVFILAFFVHVTVKAWDGVDFSRRQKNLAPNSVNGRGNPPIFEGLMGSFIETVGPVQEVVILNTEKGFIPDTLNLRKGNTYRIHVVNVNEKAKNVSFILEAFSEHYGTFYGKPREFSISPKAEGIYSFQCPETGRQGRIVVVGNDSRMANRLGKQ